MLLIHLIHLALLFRDRVGRVPRIIALVPLAALLASCGGGGGTGGTTAPPPPVTYTAKSGVAQKGPLIKGSTVTAQELDAKLSPTGKQYSYQIASDLGSFSPSSTFSGQYIGLSATGYYFDEVANAVSSGTVTLNGYSDLTAASVLNVNLLTTLAYQRIQHLVTTSNMTFAAASTQAEKEVLAALNIPTGSYGSFSTLDLGGGTDGDHILAAISSMFVYGNSAGPLSQLIANFQSDIGTNGVITSAATKSALASASKNLNPSAVAANLNQAYSSAGVTFTAANIGDWIDQNGDGVIGKFKFQVADAAPSSVFTFPSFVVDQVAGSSVSVTGGKLSVNQTPVTGAVIVQKGDVVAVSPGPGAFPNGVLTIYLVSGATNAARVSFVSGLLSIAVTPDSPSVPKGLPQQFKATGTFSDTSTADLTSSVSWTSSTPTVATVSATSGLAQPVAVGSTIITATSGSVAGSTTLNVTAAVLESLAITPNPTFSGVGLTAQMTATGTYTDGTTANVTKIAQWTSSSPPIATAGPTTGVATGVSLGSATIQATIGSVTNSASVSIVAGMWAPMASMKYPHIYHTATLLQNGKVIVEGDSGPSTDHGELYDPVANTWSPVGSMSTAREFHTATLLQNGKVLVSGGRDAAAISTPTAELYDSISNTWSKTGSMSTARETHTATLLQNGKVLVSGGRNVDGTLAGPYPLATAELYDPISNAWSPAGSMLTVRWAHTATLLQNGKVLVSGGKDLNGEALATAELYDPISNTWSAAGSMSTVREFHTATLLPNGSVLAAGGAERITALYFPIASAELYDPISNTWSLAGSMSTARLNHTATLLANGKVLVAAGRSGTGIVSTAELYDPISNTWSKTGSMSAVHEEHTATLLPNGTVLVAGGGPGSSSALFGSVSTELYFP
jgi:N-acetylneuraminic acid mutarotase